MLGDNMYGSQQPQDFVDKFERPYAPLLQAGVPFYAALGNHDQPANRYYKAFNMGGERYYTFVRRHGPLLRLRHEPDGPAAARLDRSDAASGTGALEDRATSTIRSTRTATGTAPTWSCASLLEPLLVRYGVNVVFSGHDHFYERIKPQKGITYFVEGSSGQLRKGGRDADRDDGGGLRPRTRRSCWSRSPATGSPFRPSRATAASSISASLPRAH